MMMSWLPPFPSPLMADWLTTATFFPDPESPLTQHSRQQLPITWADMLAHASKSIGQSHPSTDGGN